MDEAEHSARSLNEALARARASARFTQDEVGVALGVNRAMVSYWESGARIPNDRQISALARLYGIEPADLLEGRLTDPASADLAGLLLRAGRGIGPGGVAGIREFVRFLDRFAELRRIVEGRAARRFESPFVHRQEYRHKHDARRKAQEVRTYLGLGTGPIGDVGSACEALGVVVYRAPLGSDLSDAPSGAFLRHPEAGLSMLVNLDMTPGRQDFTVAHGLAHALFHSHETNQVLCRGAGQHERFADVFAGEFLMPSDGVRRLAEQSGMPSRMSDPADVILIQQHFGVSWPTALVRLRQMNVIMHDRYAELRAAAHPLPLARALGYPTHPEPAASDVAPPPLGCFPRSFLRMLRQAVLTGTISPPAAAAFAGLALSDITQLLGPPPDDPAPLPPHLAAEFDEFGTTGAV